MSDIDILLAMIRESIQVPLSDNYGKKKVELTEPQEKDSSITINGMPDSSIIIKTDDFKSPDSVFNCAHGECKRADFVVIADTGKKKVILCIELKKTKAKEHTIIKQLAGAKCFVTYCREIGKSFWNQPTFLDDYVYRFICIRHTSIAKKTTREKRISKSKLHNKPELMIKISGQRYLQFNHLVGK